jgi:hypothetical protein
MQLSRHAKSRSNNCGRERATDAQSMAVFGWETARTAEHYRKHAQQRKLAADAIGLINFETKSERN